jgi:phosphate ABC transporter permease protein PstC
MTTQTLPYQGPAPTSPQGELFVRSGGGIDSDRIMAALTRGAAITILLLLVSLVAVLAFGAKESIKAFRGSFITNQTWRPNELERPKRDAKGHIMRDEDGETITEKIPPSFGALPTIYGTAVSSAIALLFAVPLSFGASIFLVRIAPVLQSPGWPRSKVVFVSVTMVISLALGIWVMRLIAQWASGKALPGASGDALAGISLGCTLLIGYAVSHWLVQVVSFLIEFLAAIPSIAYGLWGLFVLSPILRVNIEPMLQRTIGRVWGFHWLVTSATGKPIPITGRDMLCGGLVLGIMIIPIITAISRDVLTAVPRAQIEGTIALGATWWQSAAEMLKFSRSALFGAVMLGLARAAGETMAITMVIGNNNQIVASPFAPAQTMSSLLANEFAEANGIHSSALVEVALILLVMSLTFNVVARWLVVGKNARTAAAH